MRITGVVSTSLDFYETGEGPSHNLGACRWQGGGPTTDRVLSFGGSGVHSEVSGYVAAPCYNAHSDRCWKVNPSQRRSKASTILAAQRLPSQASCMEEYSRRRTSVVILYESDNLSFSLQTVANNVADALEKSGLANKRREKDVVLHMTLINTKYAVSGCQGPTKTLKMLRKERRSSGRSTSARSSGSSETTTLATSK